MKKLLAVTVIMLGWTNIAAAQSVYVRPHVRSDGTYVQGHMRTAPNSTRTDNWSSSPNVNPYTGQQGTRDPYNPQVRPSTSQPKRSCSYYCY